MADRLVLELVVDDKGTATIKKFSQEGTDALSKVGKGAQDTSTSVGKLQNSWAMLAAGLASSLYIFNQIKQYTSYFINAFFEEEKASNRLAMAMQNMGEYTKKAHNELLGFASALQKTTTYGDETIVETMALLKTFGMAGDVLKDTTKSVMDMSIAMDMDLKAAAILLGKAFVGETGTLSRYGIVVDNTKSSSEKFASVLEQIQQRFGGFAQGELETYAGQWKNLKNQIGDVAEVIGKFLLNIASAGPIIDKQTQAINEQSDWFNKLFGIKTYYIKQVSPRMVESLRDEGYAWNLFSAEVKKFIPVNEDAIKGLEKLNLELRKIRIETKFVGEEEYKKRIGLIDIEIEQYKKAGVAEEEITKLKNAKIFLIEKERINQINEEYEKGLLKNIYDPEMEIARGEEDVIIELRKLGMDRAKKAHDYEMNLLQNEGDAWKLFYLEDEEDRKKREEGEKRYAEEVWKIERKLTGDIAQFTQDEYDFKKQSLDEQLRIYEGFGIDRLRLETWYNIELKKLDDEKTLRGNNFFAGMKIAHERALRDQKTMAQQGADIYKDFTSRSKGFFNDLTDSFIAGEDLKVSAQKAAGNMMVGLAGDISKRMYSAAIEKIISLIGAYIGQGAAASGGAGAMKGGVAGALTEIGIYLGTAVTSMLAGRAMASQFRAEGGWLSSHPQGGWIHEGSGNRDDVFLGMTPGTRHWGMGGEFVINKESAQKHAPLLEAINRKHDTGGPIGTQENWTAVADTLAAGSGASFLHGFIKGSFPGAIAEAIAFYTSAVVSMFTSKYAANKFMASGGLIDQGHGWGSFLGLPIWTPPSIPFISDIFNWLEDAWKGTIGKLPGGQYLPNPFTIAAVTSDPERAKDWIVNLIRAPNEQIAKDLMTPNKYYSDGIEIAKSNISNASKLFEGITGAKIPFFHGGIDYVPQTGPAFLHQGERVISKEDNIRGIRPITVNLNIDGNLIGDKKTFDDFVDKIHQRLSLLQDWGYR